MPILPQVVELYSHTIREFGKDVIPRTYEWKPYYAWELKSDQEARRSTKLEASVGTTTALTQIWSMIHGQLGEFKRVNRELGEMFFAPKNPPGSDFRDETKLVFSSLDPDNFDIMLKFADILEKNRVGKQRKEKKKNPLVRPYIQFFHVDQEPYDDTFKHETRKKSFNALESSFGENLKELDVRGNMIDFLMWQLENTKFVGGKRLNSTDFVYQAYRNLSSEPRREGFRLMEFDPLQTDMFGKMFEEAVPIIKEFGRNIKPKKNPLLRAYVRFSVFVDGKKVTGGDTEWEPPDEHKDQKFKDQYYGMILNQYWHPKEVLLKISPTKYQSVGPRSQVIELIGFTPDMIETFEKVFDARKAKYAAYAAMTDEERERDSNVKAIKKMRKKYGRNPIVRPLIVRDTFNEGCKSDTRKYTFPEGTDRQAAIEHIDAVLGVGIRAGTKFYKRDDKYVIEPADTGYGQPEYVFTLLNADPSQIEMVEEVWADLQKAVAQAEKTNAEVERMTNRFISRSKSKNPNIELKDGKVLAEGKPLSELPLEVLEENIVFYHNTGQGNFFSPSGWFFLNLVDTNEHAHEVANAPEKSNRPIVFFPATLSRAPNFPKIWKKRMYHPGIIGAVQGQFIGDTLNIEYMAVRPKFRRNKVNTAMIEFLKDKLKPAKVVYHELTKDGKEFHKSRVGEKAKNPILKPNVWMYNSDFTAKIVPRSNERLRTHFGQNLDGFSSTLNMENFLHTFGFTDIRSGQQLAPTDFMVNGIDRLSGYKNIYFRLNNFTPDQVAEFADGFLTYFDKRKSNPVGGLAEGMSPSDFNSRELKRGTKVEMEHTSDPKLAEEIAMDHLVEDPNYYKKLAKMEKNPICRTVITQSYFGAKFDETTHNFEVWNLDPGEIGHVLDSVMRRHIKADTSIRRMGDSYSVVEKDGSYWKFELVCPVNELQIEGFKKAGEALVLLQDEMKVERRHLKKVAKSLSRGRQRQNPEHDWDLVHKEFNPKGQPKYGGSGARALFDRLSYYMKNSAKATEAQLATFTRLWPLLEEMRHFGEIDLNIVPEYLGDDDINATNPGAIIISFGEEGDMSVGIAGSLLFEVVLKEDGSAELREYDLPDFIASLEDHSHDLRKDSLEFRVLLNQLDVALNSGSGRATKKVKE